ncbi:hypothetical protein LTR10_019148 [Elasticomyces elasticus]|nr:hypothetical protein LTR10_019148 [Elasticomyces elasticus]KAK5025468.1 hypothetical protein LTR13_010432 [Exophiala sideris]KAK5029740.1 hypothetical protein LTS07_005464 [Exophiala sideris]KAK5178529.1 hypothetical protein LTR44_008900 [Eurotiomycetes sp. CCFEE 6388]
MTPKVFVTGATGYIGGDGLFEIARAHPDWDITCAIRNSDKAAKIALQYPSIKLVHADLNAVDVIEEEASKADVVFHFANCDHEASATAITIDRGCWGDELSKVYDDWVGVEELTSLPDHAEHRNVDKLVLEASKIYPDKIKTAIVCPPAIFGRGRGPDNQRSVQIYRVTEAFLKHKRAFTVGKGNNIWNQVHVQDLSRLYLLLGEAAVNNGDPATWDDHGYYLAENGTLVWKDVIEAVAGEISNQCHIDLTVEEELSPEEAAKLLPYAKYLIGTNCRGISIRARKLLGWKPRERSLMDEIPAIVESEAASLGLVSPQNHAVD